MRAWTSAAAALLLAASSAACTGGTQPLSTIGSGPVSYSCVLADAYSPAVPDPSAPSTLRRRSVTLQRAGQQIVLDLGAGNTQHLEPVAGASGRLFANADFGWRIADARSVLTDVREVRTYNCASGDAAASGRPAPG